MKQIDTKDMIRGNNAFENGIYMLIGKEFGGAAAGFEVRWEAKNFKPSRFDHVFLTDIKEQATGAKEKIAEIYFQGQYVCDVSEKMHPEVVRKTITENLMYIISKKGGV